MKKEWRDKISAILRVEPLRINSALVSAQNRDRLYWTNIPGVSVPQDRHIGLNTIIGDYDCIWVCRRGKNKGGLKPYIFAGVGKSPAVTCSSWQYNFFPVIEGVKRRFMINEVEQIQTLPIDYTAVPGVSSTARFVACGNGWTLEVIKHLFRGLLIEGQKN